MPGIFDRINRMFRMAEPSGSRLHILQLDIAMRFGKVENEWRLTLGELGREFVIAEYKTVASAIKRFELSPVKDSAKRKTAEKCIRELQNMET